MRRLLLLLTVTVALLVPALVAHAALTGSDRPAEPVPAVDAGAESKTAPAGSHGKLGPHGKKGQCPFAADPAI